MPKAWRQLADVITHHDPQCRGVLLLGLEASENDLALAFRAAADEPLCKGFAVGRSIFADAAAAWFAGSSTTPASSRRWPGATSG